LLLVLLLLLLEVVVVVVGWRAKGCHSLMVWSRDPLA
jgi:hypothetical protein